MTLWKLKITVDELNQRNRQNNRKTIHDSLGIQFTEIGEDFIEATMPVDGRTHQPFGILHGGASVVLAESLGSIASNLVINSPDKIAVGIEVNASHLNKAESGFVTGRVTPIRIGRSLHVWQIQIRADSDLQSKPICHARLTVTIINR